MGWAARREINARPGPWARGRGGGALWAAAAGAPAHEARLLEGNRGAERRGGAELRIDAEAHAAEGRAGGDEGEGGLGRELEGGLSGPGCGVWVRRGGGRAPGAEGGEGRSGVEGLEEVRDGHGRGHGRVGDVEGGEGRAGAGAEAGEEGGGAEGGGAASELDVVPEGPAGAAEGGEGAAGAEGAGLVGEGEEAEDAELEVGAEGVHRGAAQRRWEGWVEGLGEGVTVRSGESTSPATGDDACCALSAADRAGMVRRGATGPGWGACAGGRTVNGGRGQP